MKHCLKCSQAIDENNAKEKWCMIITKMGLRVVGFECFHACCFDEFWEESVEMAVDGRKTENY